MSPFRFQFFSKLGLEFWLSLPLIAAGFWFGLGWFTEKVLSQTYATTAQLKTQNQQQVSLSLTLTVLSIDAEIDRRMGDTEVTIQTTGSTLQELEFEYPVTEFAEVEAAIAQELGLPTESIRNLIRYRVD